MLLITHATLVNWFPRQLETDQAVLIANNRIKAIGPTAELVARYPDATQRDAAGKLLLPGNICAHTHFYGAFARGMAIPGPAPRDFPEILQRLWWPLDKALALEDVHLSALVCLVDAIKHGTTTLIDHHASPNAIDGSLSAIADAVTQAGLRAVLCYEVSDRDGAQKAQAGIAENTRFMRVTSAYPTVRATFGLHASLTLSDETLKACVAANPTGGFHIHVAEHEADELDSLARYGKRTVHRLREAGILDPQSKQQSIVAHAVHIDDSEQAALVEAGAWVTHQPRSNMNNAVGAAKIDQMLEAGIKLCLGNDGFSNDMIAEWKAAYFLHKVVNRDPRRANGDAIVKMAVEHNAALANQFFTDAQLGQIVVDAAADMILVDYHPFTPLTSGNLPWHLLFGYESSMVTATICNGAVLMWDRQLLTLDEARIAAAARARAVGVWERYAQFSKAALG